MKTKWINVKDRLPDKTGEYLTWNGIFFYCEQFIVSGQYWESQIESTHVTHWQPLPEPPTN